MGHSVVVVEDEDILRQLIAINLARRGCEVREAETAGEAISLVEAKNPDLMLLDINLPDRSGWDILRELRRRNIEVPTIVISAVRVSQDRIHEFHPLAYLPKPFSLEALLRLVDGTPAAQPEPEALLVDREGGDILESREENDST